jgi:DUF1680 family protein
MNAGLPSEAQPLGGWERPDCEVRGHSLGHYLSACALMYASTGDEQIKAKADRIVTELAQCQQALGNGYLSAFPESHIDRAEECRPVWAPYYCLHKMMAGLLDMYIHCENKQALEIVRAMAAWCKSRCDELSPDQMQQMLDRTEQGGMNEALANLYALTGDPNHLALSRRFVQHSYNDPLAEERDELKGQHVNSFIPNIIGTARQYEVAGEPRDRRIADFFWDQVTRARCYCTGGTSNHEHWQTDPYKLATELSDHTQETCCTYNMLKLTRHLFCWDPESRYADYYERALFNSILSTQDPETGMMMYFVPLASGRWKYYNLPTESFWCCTGTGMENHAKYGDSIYFHDREGIYVNLFVASELDWSEKGLRIRQETRFPEEDATRILLHAERPTELAVRVRVPDWTDGHAPAKLNDQPLNLQANAAGYLEIRRTWHDGDRLDVAFPMKLRVHPMPDDDTLVAFLYGPLVLAGRLGAEGLTEEMTCTTENWYRFPRDQIAQAPMLVVDSDDLDDWIKPAAGDPLTFRTAGQSRDVTLVPYHRLFGERYAVYWHVYRRGSPEHHRALAAQEARDRYQARCADEVQIGDRRSESAHSLKGERTQAGSHQGRFWRHAKDGGWFSYRLGVLPDQPMTLRLTYWGSDAGKRTFDILVDGRQVGTQTLNRNRPEDFFEVDYPLPEEWTRNKQEVTVTFRAHPGNFAGGIFGCAMLKPQQQ